MASRKDFVQRSRKQTSASPNRPAAAKPRAKAAPPPKRKPWAMALFSLVGLAGLIFVLNQLLNVDSTQPARNAGSTNSSNSNASSNKNTAVKTPTPAKPSAEKRPSTTVVKQTENSKKSSLPKVVDKSVKAEVAAKQSKYEFYELLPKSEIRPTAVEEYKSTPKDAKLDKHYVLQAGSFRNAADAEKMRAQLLLSGLSNVHTSQSNGSNGLWYRVRLGPFDNRSVMNKAHDKLARMNINAMTVRID